MVVSVVNIRTRNLSASSQMARIQEASQVPASETDIYVLRFMTLDITYHMVAYVASYVETLVNAISGGKPLQLSPEGLVPLPLEDFILSLCRRNKVTVGTLSSALIYLSRLRERMSNSFGATPTDSTPHRLFFSALIVASKFSNDVNTRNKHWAHYVSGLWTLDEINVMERQFLNVIDYDLTFDEDELIWHLKPVFDLLGPHLSDGALFQRANQEFIITRTRTPALRNLVMPPARSSYPQVLRRKGIIKEEDSQADRESRLEARTTAIRRLERGSQERVERHPNSAAPSALITPSRMSARASSRINPRTDAPPSDSQRSGLGITLTRALSIDSDASDSSSGLTADETSISFTSSDSASSSNYSMTSEDSLDNDDAGIIRIVASLNMDDDDLHSGATSKAVSDVENLAGVGAIGMRGDAGKSKFYGALQTQRQTNVQQPEPARRSRFSWSRRRSGTTGAYGNAEASPMEIDERRTSRRLDRHFHNGNPGHHNSAVDLYQPPSRATPSYAHTGSRVPSPMDVALRKSSSRRSSCKRNSRSQFSSSTGTIAGHLSYPTNFVLHASSPTATGVAPAPMSTNSRRVSTATITPGKFHGGTCRYSLESGAGSGQGGSRFSMKSGGGSGIAASKSSGSGFGSMGMSISASIRSFLTGGSNTGDRV